VEECFLLLPFPSAFIADFVRIRGEGGGILTCLAHLLLCCLKSCFIQRYMRLGNFNSGQPHLRRRLCHHVTAI
jgi:hypothetical protein